MRREKRLLIAILVAAAALIAALPVSLGESAAATIFDGKVLSGYKYNTTTGSQFSLVSVAPLSKVAIDFPGESVIVENKSCSSGRMFQACYNGATFKGYNYSLPDREVYEFSIKIALVAPEFAVAKSLEKYYVDVGESTVIHVNITNAGSAQGSMRFTESVPAQLKIVELPGQACGLSLNNTLTMAVDMKSGEVRHCDYKVTALVPGTYTLTSAVSYDVIKTETAKATATVSVNALPFSVVENISNSYLLGDLLNVSLLLKPGANLSSFVFSAFIPVGIKVFSVNKEAVLARQAGGASVAYGDKKAVFGSDAYLSISSQLAHVGASVISTNSSWAYNGLEQGLIKDILVNVTFGRPYIRISKYDNVTEKLYMDVVNPAHLPIYNVTVIPAAGVAAFSVGEIGSAGHASFSDAPQQSYADNKANYTGKIVYHTGYGQKLSEPFSLSVNASVNSPLAAAPEANETNIVEELPVNSSQGEIVKKQKPQPRELVPAEIRTAVIMVAIIIAIIVIFFAIRGREKGFAEENSSDELR